METSKSCNPASKRSAQFLKQRKFMLMVPLLILPFLSMAFWALGGGTGNGERDAQQIQRGLNTTLPKPQLNNNTDDKMGIYDQSRHDSIHNSKDGISNAFVREMGLAGKTGDSIQLPKTINGPSDADVNEAKVRQKLAQLSQQISEPSQSPARLENYGRPSEDVTRLHRMMKTMNGNHGDPEMRQLNQMLDKIQAIQNPGSVAPKTVNKTSAVPFRAIPAIVDGKQKVIDGAVVRLKLTDSTTIKNQLLKKGQLLFGACQVTNQRLLLTIRNIRTDNNIIPVDLTVFSLDGLPGIPAPEAELAGSASLGADNAIQSMQIMSMDQSIAAQAAAGGVNAAKSFFSKKVKKIKVKLKDKFPVLLKINR